MTTENKTTSLELVTKIVKDLLKRMQCMGTVEASLKPLGQNRMQLSISIDSDDSRHLIGQHGANLQSLQHVIRLLVSAKTGRPCFARVDINNYRGKREEQILDLAIDAAAKALQTDNMVILRPMSAFERRLIHVALQKKEGISTESLGQDPNRRVVVKPSHKSKVVNSFKDKGLTLDDINV